MEAPLLSPRPGHSDTRLSFGRRDTFASSVRKISRPPFVQLDHSEARNPDPGDDKSRQRALLPYRRAHNAPAHTSLTILPRFLPIERTRNTTSTSY